MTAMRNKIITVVMLSTMFMACEKYQLPGEGSIPDLTPPQSSFTATQGQGPDEEWKDYVFSNQSISATTYLWDFGDGNTSDEVDGFNTYPGEGTYTVTLTASDNLGVESTSSLQIVVVEPEAPEAIIPVIKEASFEDNSPGAEDCGSGLDGRDCWRNSDLGGVIQITSSPVFDGEQASKYPSAGDRIAYQELTISPNTDYILTYYYTLKTGNPGSITMSVLAGGGFTDLSAALDAAIAEHVGTDQEDSNQYTQVNLPFNTGANDVISLLVTNEGEEARMDFISIDVAPE